MRYLTILLVVLLLSMPCSISAQQSIDAKPLVMLSLSDTFDGNATQDWSSHEFGISIAGPRITHIISVYLADNLTSIFGEKSLYLIALEFSILDFGNPALHIEEFILENDTRVNIPVQLNATTEYNVYVTFNILSGNSRNSSVSVDMTIDAIVLPDFQLDTNEEGYELATTVFPDTFTTEPQFLWDNLGEAFVFLPQDLFTNISDFKITLVLEVQILDGPMDGEIRIDVSGAEDTLELTPSSPLIMEFEIPYSSILQLDILADTSGNTFAFSNVTVLIPDVLATNNFTLPDLPPGGIVVGTGFVLSSIGLVYAYAVKSIEEDIFG